MNHNSHQGFSLIEILLTSMFIAIVFIPLMISLSRIQNNYLNLKSHFYAQLIAQTNLELATNILQGRNPIDNSNPDRFITLLKSTMTTTDITNPTPIGKVLNITTYETLYFNISNTLPSQNSPHIIIPINNPASNYGNTTTLNNQAYSNRLVAYPICRDTTTNQIASRTPTQTSCPSGTSQDPHSLEIASEIRWTPPGSSTEKFYEVKTIFTDYETHPNP